ncbi:exodeoxyribonuclease VII small subunit [Roseateles saccharophilus]|uniref:Exodeoxyribonuclease 7 small subunit n=1 Tax=Roseateles saccharophilus TaxID=304 RepID=A0A4R3V520_ROSSA|nr:exodeoxyribonuclease VII small subunit [Roseateles saccharophilus]MDG0831434.1 exodeoxyribonuclease VII small subunit [Roseateles saccharophilus]TCU98682.1 exodeoxyribonuclease VII small subunit [Roseateles saccharophilus]
MTKSSPRTKAAATDGSELSYEQALDELERLVAAMEGQQLPLDQLLHAYKRGAELLALCRGRLRAVEQQVKLLDDGELKAWEGS